MGVGARRLRTLWLSLLVMLLVPAAASAATLHVTSTANSGAGSLRAEIAAANAGDTVSVPASSTHYTVSSEIPITVALTIQGGGAAGTIIDGGNSTRIFHVTSTVPSGSGVTIAGLTLTGGATTADPGGGAILVDSGTLAITDATLSNDTADVDIGPGRAGGGGAIYNAGGDTTLTRATLTGDQTTVHSAPAGGGSNPCCDGGGAIFQQAGSVTVTDSTLTGNSATVNGPDTGTGSDTCCGGGGAVYQNAPQDSVTISGSTVSNNTATINGGECCHGGGAVYLDSNSSQSAPTLVIANSHLDHDRTVVKTQTLGQGCCSGGGAVATFGGMSATDATFDYDTATLTNQECCNGGGAINVDAGSAPLTFTRTDLSHDTFNLDTSSTGGTNDTCCNGGGAMQLDLNQARLTLTDSLVSHDLAHLNGTTQSGAGAIYEDTPSGFAATFSNSTLADNTTDAAGPANGQMGGGSLWTFNGTNTFQNTTLTGNTAPQGTGGAVLEVQGAVHATNSILAGNSAAGTANCQASPSSGQTATFTSGGHNIEDANTCGFTGTGDLINTNPLLGSLQDNGGPFETVPLLTGSPAIDGADSASCPSADMRGVARPQPAGGRCDIGAYEAVGPIASTQPASAITPGGATLNAAVNPENLNTSVHYEYGTTTAYGSATSAQVLSGYGNQDPAGAIGQLTPRTTYHYRIVASNQLGTATGTDSTFTTPAPTPVPVPNTGPGHVVPFGKVAFASSGNGVVGVFVGCFGNACLGRATLVSGSTTLASRKGFGIGANDGSFVHLRLSTAARRALATNSRHHVSATLVITDTSGHTSRTNLTVISFSARPTAGAARVGGAAFGGNAFVNGSTAGVFVGCFSIGRCTGTAALGGATKTVSYGLPAASGGLVSVPLSSSTVTALSRKGQLRERLRLTDNVTRSTQRATVTLVSYR